MGRITGLSDPPTYMVRMVLGLAGLRLTDDEKMAWKTSLRFEGQAFHVHDWKNSSWSMSWSPDDETGRQRAERLIGKIRRAAREVDQALQDAFRPEIEAENIYLHNTYLKVTNAYWHFRQRVDDSMQALDETPQEDKPSDWTAQLTKALQHHFDVLEQIALDGYAMVGFYYSSLDVFFDVVLALKKDRPCSFAEFSGRRWQEKFKVIFDVGGAAKAHYDELLELKRLLRDPLFHGLGQDARVLVSLSGLGLVPVSYEYLARSLHYTPSMADDAWIRRAISAFDAFDNWLDETEPYLYARKFACTGLPVPLNAERAEGIRVRMTSPTDFDAWIEQEERRVDYRLNRYQ